MSTEKRKNGGGSRDRRGFSFRLYSLEDREATERRRVEFRERSRDQEGEDVFPLSHLVCFLTEEARSASSEKRERRPRFPFLFLFTSFRIRAKKEEVEVEVNRKSRSFSTLSLVLFATREKGGPELFRA